MIGTSHYLKIVTHCIHTCRVRKWGHLSGLDKLFIGRDCEIYNSNCDDTTPFTKRRTKMLVFHVMIIAEQNSFIRLSPEYVVVLPYTARVGHPFVGNLIVIHENMKFYSIPNCFFWNEPRFYNFSSAVL